MTFTEIVSRVGEDLNLTSTEAVARIGRRVNERYRRVASSIGMLTVSRVSFTENTVPGNPLIVVTGGSSDIEKVVTVRDAARGLVLDEVTLDEIRNMDPRGVTTGPPRCYAVEHQGAVTVTLYLYPTPTDIRALSIDALATKATLSGTDVPDFAASFHDVLVFGALADESRKIDKRQSEVFEGQFNQRLSDLRFYLAKSSYLSQGQGRGARPRWIPTISHT
jgi:hypothetical protein